MGVFSDSGNVVHAIPEKTISSFATFAECISVFDVSVYPQPILPAKEFLQVWGYRTVIVSEQIIFGLKRDTFALPNIRILFIARGLRLGKGQFPWKHYSVIPHLQQEGWGLPVVSAADRKTNQPHALGVWDDFTLHLGDYPRSFYSLAGCDLYQKTDKQQDCESGDNERGERIQLINLIMRVVGAVACYAFAWLPGRFAVDSLLAYDGLRAALRFGGFLAIMGLV